MALDSITTQTLISSLIEFILIFIVCLLGAYVKDTYNKLVHRTPYKIKVSRILISGIVASVVMYSLSSIMVPKFGVKICLLPWFISGTIGFQVLGKISKLDFWLNFGKAIFENKSAIQRIIETAHDAAIEEEIDENVEERIEDNNSHNNVSSIESNQSVNEQDKKEEDKQ